MSVILPEPPTGGTFATSVIQAYTDALLANLKARAGLATTYITDGPPPASVLNALGADMVQRWLMLGDVTGDQSWAAIDRQRRPKNEEFTLNCVISCVSASTALDDGVQSVLNSDAIGILAEIEQELRGNPTQGVGPGTGITTAGYVIESQIATPLNLQKRASDTMREAGINFGIRVKARL